jgi:hypothetical protein
MTADQNLREQQLPLLLFPQGIIRGNQAVDPRKSVLPL